MKTIIAICGVKRSGKNTVGNYIGEYFVRRRKFVKFLSFGDTVKETVSVMMGFDKDYFKNESVKEKIFGFIDGKTYSGREIFQLVGTEAIRNNFNKSTWITALNNKLIYSNCDINIITDLRFRNEYDYLKTLKDKYNVIIIRVYRSSVQSNDTHASETEVNKFDYDCNIHNDVDSLEDLKQKVNKICENLEII